MNDTPHSDTALLIMDVQRNVVDLFVPEPHDTYLERIERAIAGARSAEMLIIYVRVALRPGYPEISPRNPLCSGLIDLGGYTEDDPGTELHPRLHPLADEPIVTKRRASAFGGSDLHQLLRARGITKLAMAGIATHGVVLFTAAEALDADYSVVILSDGCVDNFPDVHEALIGKVFPRWGEVVTIDSWLQRVAHGEPTGGSTRIEGQGVVR